MFSLHVLHTILLAGLHTLSAVEGEAVATPFVKYPGNVKLPAEVVGVAGALSNTLPLGAPVCIHIHVLYYIFLSR